MRRHTVRSTLMLTYSAIILAAFCAVAVIYSAMQVPDLKRQTFASLTQNTAAITTSMDNELNQMRTVALNIAYSTLVQERFFSQVPTRAVHYSHSEDARVLSELLATLIFPNRPVDQINLYSINNTVISSGVYSGINEGFAAEQPWYEQVQEAANHQAIQFTGSEQKLSKYYTGIYGKEFVSFAMQNYNNFNNPYGYIEIKQRLSHVVSAALGYTSVYGEQVYVYDANGTLLHPIDAAGDPALFSFARQRGFPQEVTLYPSSKNKEHIICAHSQRSGFCTIMVISEKKLLQPVYDFAKNILFITIGILFLALFLAYFAARCITAPIYAICNQIKNIDLSTAEPLPSLDTNVLEIQTLHRAFSTMQCKLSESVNKQLLLQTQEMQSRMLALQSQMNPHFLYNSLAAIQAMADEGMAEEISVMCQSMSNILRYVSSDAEHEVLLSDEIFYTKDYLRCMVVRYQGDFSYIIQIPEEMDTIQVPKLCVQLLVENAIKFSTTKRPPYSVSIMGIADEKHYEITIQDNGPGFDEKTLGILQQKIAIINDTNLLPSLEINGMGLLNVYIRYWLLYGERTIFRMESSPSGGASVTIGEVYDEP